MTGPFEITRQIGNLYEVKLLETMKIHNVFSLDYLQKVANNPLPGQVNNPLPLIVVNTEQE